MMNFCTYFDSGYLHKGIALYLSLENVTSDFHLFVMAYDEQCYKKLKKFGFKHMTVELWDDWETPEIKAVKGDRTRAEYCWTCGPSVIYHFLTSFNLLEITYLDSDLYFVEDPKVAFDEIGEKSVAITEQRVSEERADQVGKYCVQFMYFRNDAEGLSALTWWRDACIDWCYQRFEDGKYADQKYLDEFPKRWSNVCVIENPGVGLAPWNTDRYKYVGSTVFDGEKEWSQVFFHMHGLSFEQKGKVLEVSSINYDMRGNSRKYFYEPYSNLMKEVLNQYLNWNVDIVNIRSFGLFRRFYFYMRTKLRTNKLFKWLYYDVFHMMAQGHGLNNK